MAKSGEVREIFKIERKLCSSLQSGPKVSHYPESLKRIKVRHGG